MPAPLDPARLENVRTVNGKTLARCPACAESGGDKSGEHLVIQPSGRWGCVKHPGAAGAEHRRRIFALVGRKNPAPQPARRSATRKPGRTWPDPEAAARACTPEGVTFEAVYLYPRDGKPWGAVGRYRLPDGKTFRQFHVNGQGWERGAPSGLWPLYRVEALAPEGALYVVEGEKCQHAAAALGLAATTSAGASGAAAKSDWRPLAGRDVVLLPDNDEAGQWYARDVATILSGLNPPASVRTVRLPVTEPGADIVDFMDERDAQEPETLRAEIEALAAAVKPDAEATAGLDGASVLRDAPPAHTPVLAGLFDRQALVEVVGPSKTRKSFAVLQLALALAAGRAVFGFSLGGTFSVCVADMELSDPDLRRRTWRMGRAMGIGPADIGDRLRILPLAGLENCRDAIETAADGFDILICDPLYSLCEGSETIENFREPLRWLRRLAVGRAACLFVHHDGKGCAGDRETRDRGSGSGITGSAVDARITLTPAAADPDNTVIAGFMCRSYVCPAPSAWTFADDAFRPSDLPVEPERQSDRRARQARPKLEGYRDAGLRILRADGPMSPAVFKRRLRDELNASKGDADDLTARLCEDGGPAVRWREGGFATAWKIGTTEQAPSSRLLPGKKQEEGEEG